MKNDFSRNDNDDNENWEGLSRKLPSHYKPHIRRRLPKRYSDLVSPTSTKIFLSRKDSFNRDRTSTNILRRHSLKPINETIYFFNPSRRKSRENIDYRQHPDHLAQRMQAVLSSELMNSLDRNLIVNQRKPCVPRSHSFNITMNRKQRRVERKFSYHFIPRVKMNFEQRNIFIEEPTPDYDESTEEILIRTNHNNIDVDDEPTVDYEDTKAMFTGGESEEKTTTQSDQCASSSFIVPQTSINVTDEQQQLTPSIPPPPLLDLNTTSKPRGFRCRTIADKLSSDHKLILKDQEDEKEEQKSNNPPGEYS